MTACTTQSHKVFAPSPQNIFSQLPIESGVETLLPLFESNNVKIERIVSRSASSPPDFWYNQDHDEWIILIKGTTELRFADGKSVIMNAGDYLLIPKHEKHRVEHTSEEAVWLAVHVTTA